MNTCTVYANKYWNDTGIVVQPGLQYRISVVPGQGEPLKDARYVASSIEGEDWISLPHTLAELARLKRVNTARWFALIGTIAKSNPWVVNPDIPFCPTKQGELVFFFNDVCIERFYKNNSGHVVLAIESSPV